MACLAATLSLGPSDPFRNWRRVVNISVETKQHRRPKHANHVSIQRIVEAVVLQCKRRGSSKMLKARARRWGLEFCLRTSIRVHVPPDQSSCFSPKILNRIFSRVSISSTLRGFSSFGVGGRAIHGRCATPASSVVSAHDEQLHISVGLLSA
jgi:hypothetical protein